VQGSDNPIPLSPQWLLPKPGENKLGTGSVVCASLVLHIHLLLSADSFVDIVSKSDIGAALVFQK